MEEKDDNKLIEERREKLKALRASGIAYPNDFRKKDFAVDLHKRFSDSSKDDLDRSELLTKSSAASLDDFRHTRRKVQACEADLEQTQAKLGITSVPRPGSVPPISSATGSRSSSS